jgi:hypothetical protein
MTWLLAIWLVLAVGYLAAWNLAKWWVNAKKPPRR